MASSAVDRRAKVSEGLGSTREREQADVREMRQKANVPRGETTRSATAWMMTAERMALLQEGKSGVRTTRTTKVSRQSDGDALGNKVEGVGQGVEGDDDADAGPPAGGRRADARLALERRAREGAGRGVGREDHADEVGDADRDELLVGVDLVGVDAAKRLGDRDVFEQEDDGRDGDLARKGAEQLWVDLEQADVAEAGGYVLEDRDRVGLLLMDGDSPSDDGKDDDDEGVAEDARKEGDPTPARVACLDAPAGPLDGIDWKGLGEQRSASNRAQVDARHRGTHGRRAPGCQRRR
jgi:hypothetical protein